MSEMIRCHNCRALIDIHSEKCEYCGYINESGAEEKYMQSLDEIKEQLDNVDNEALSGYFDEAKSASKKILKIAAIIFAIFLILLVAYIYISKEMDYSTNKSKSDEIDEIVWQNDNFDRYDEMYEAGEFEELAAIFSSDEVQGHEIYQWSHYNIINSYSHYVVIRDEYVPILDDGESIENWASSMLFDSFFFYYRVYETDASIRKTLSDDDIATLEEIRDYVTDIIYNRFGFTDKELEGFKADGKILKNGYIDFSDCKALASQYSSQFR